MLENRRAYETQLDAQLAEWKADLDVLKAKARRTEGDAKVNYDKVIDALEQKHDEAGKLLRELQSASDEAWENVKTGTEKVWLEIKSQFQSSSEKP